VNDGDVETTVGFWELSFRVGRSSCDCPDYEKSVIPRGIAAEGGDPAYPGFFTMEPEMVARDFCF